MAMTEKQDEFFCALYRECAKHLWRWAYRCLGDRELSSELVQDTFVVLMLKIDAVMRYENPEAWLFQVMANQIWHEKRQFAVHEYIPIEECPDIPSDDHLMDGLEELIPSAFSEEERNLFIWYYRDRYSFGEISKVLGISEDACRMKLLRLRKRLKKILRDF